MHNNYIHQISSGLHAGINPEQEEAPHFFSQIAAEQCMEAPPLHHNLKNPTGESLNPPDPPTNSCPASPAIRNCSTTCAVFVLQRSRH